MKIKVSKKTRETINAEYKRFMADPTNIEGLKRKLSYNQRVFLESFKDAYQDESGDIDPQDKLLLFQEAMLTFSVKPELVPNAPIDFLKSNISFKEAPDDFEQLLIMIKVWSNSIKRSKNPLNKLAVFFGKWYKLALYPFFVTMLTVTFTSALNIGTSSLLYHHFDTLSISTFVVTAIVSISAGRGIYFRILAEHNLK